MAGTEGQLGEPLEQLQPQFQVLQRGLEPVGRKGLA